jgi:hypothetical protein
MVCAWLLAPMISTDEKAFCGVPKVIPEQVVAEWRCRLPDLHDEVLTS